ncbi:transposable element Tc1 transposase [Trichonephila clavipes]|nr:transposable element Tc1 transposase [Trichonephila clavipes]
MPVWKQCADEHRTTRKTDDQHLLGMAVNDRTASSRQFAARWSTVTGVLMIPLMANHLGLRLQRAHEHRAWQADWHQVVFSDESRFNLWDHEGRIRVRPLRGKLPSRVRYRTT